ncbi:hypothetical protein Taro_046756 [Colocasia esculenta]|uniref:Ubiquitin-like protease family profile domain-containing protein n=1 Tax=Colocasia esculenta TaxID=4460 RepID=A0A843WZH9_COLES|nr:hypothetical protein [Colocasia esculenta]
MLICLDNIEEIGRYNWAAAVTEMTLHKFDDFMTVVREKRSGRNTTPKRRIAGREHGSVNIFGCSAALVVWFLEHTRLRQPIDREVIPRLFRWGSVLDKKLSFFINSLQGQQIIKHLKLATKEKTAITGVSQEKMHVQTEGVAAPPHPTLMGLLQGLGDEIRLLPERLQQSKSSDEAHFEALTTAVTMGFNKIEKLISLTSMAQDQPTFGTDAEKFFSTPPSLTPASAAPAYGDANASVLIVEQGIIAPDPVSVVPTTALISLTSLIKNIKCRDDRQLRMYDQSPFRRLDKAPKKQTPYQQKKGKKAMSKLLRFYKEWTCKFEASERQRALVEAFLAEEGYVDHKDKKNRKPLSRIRTTDGISFLAFSAHGLCLQMALRGHKLYTSLGHEKLGFPLSDFQFLFFVAHVSNHWFLLSLQVEQSRIVVYNFYRGHATYDTCARNWEPILKVYLRYKGYRNADEFQLIFDEKCPQQPNSIMNCAMYCFILGTNWISAPQEKGFREEGFREEGMGVFEVGKGGGGVGSLLKTFVKSLKRKGPTKSGRKRRVGWASEQPWPPAVDRFLCSSRQTQTDASSSTWNTCADFLFSASGFSFLCSPSQLAFLCSPSQLLVSPFDSIDGPWEERNKGSSRGAIVCIGIHAPVIKDCPEKIGGMNGDDCHTISWPYIHGWAP